MRITFALIWLAAVPTLGACRRDMFDASALAEAETPQATLEASSLPETAIGPVIDYQRGYAVVPVAVNVWVATDSNYQAMFAATGKGVVVFDAPASMTATLPQAIAETTDEPVTHLVYSHSHIDHIGGAGAFGDDVTIIASAETTEKLKRFSDNANRSDPNITFETDFTLVVGDLTVQLSALGDGHEPGNLFISLPDDKVLMAVDLVYPGWVPFTNLGMAEDIGLYVENHDALLAYDFDAFVGGHLGRPGTREDLQIAKDYLRDLIAFAEDGRQQTDFAKVGQRVGFDDKWRLVKAYMDDVADHCSERMIAIWGDRLGGAETSTPGHCWVMQEFLNINGAPHLD